MARILANDGIHPSGKLKLEAAGHTVQTDHIPMDSISDHLNEWDAIIVRSATKVRKEHFDLAPNLKMVVRAGVGMDNIDVEYGRTLGVHVTNTPEASSRSVAELAMAHLLSLSRGLHQSHLHMPTSGAVDFKKLKKAYSSGFELEGKTIGIIGFGRIGQELARICLAMGMNVLAYDLMKQPRNIAIPTEAEGNPVIQIPIFEMDQLLAESDIISVHVPSVGKALLGADEIAQMKPGVVLINTARGGVIDESALLSALASGHVRAAGLDVYDNEPTPSQAILSHPDISLTPHIGASTAEAQEKIALLAADKIIAHFS